MGLILVLALVLAILALGFFLYLELEELAAGAAVAVVGMAAVGIWLQMAATLAIIGILVLSLAAMLFYRLMRRHGQPGVASGKPPAEH